MAIQKKEDPKKIPTIAEVEELAKQAIAEPVREEKVEQLDDVARRTKEQMKTFDQVDIFIPLDPTNPADDIYPVNINGYTIQIPKGKPYKVPKPFYDVWLESYNASMRASGMIKSADPRKDDPLAEL